MFNALKDWVQGELGSKYIYSAGPWIDTSGTAYYCALYSMGGSAVDAGEIRRARYRVLLVGPREGRAKNGEIMADIESLIQRSMGDSLPCGAASVRALGEVTGPAYTTENRAWASVDFQITF